MAEACNPTPVVTAADAILVAQAALDRAAPGAMVPLTPRVLQMLLAALTPQTGDTP